MSSYRLSLLLLIFFAGATLASAAVMPRAEGAEAASNRREAQRQERRNERVERLRHRLEHKLEKRLERRRAKAAPGVWDDSRFRLGVILVLGALAIALLGALLNAGFFGFIAGLVGLVGIVLVIWSLIEYYG